MGPDNGDGDRTDVLVLGPIAVRHHGQLIIPTSVSGRVLLANIALGGHRGIGDDALLERMWPDGSATASMRALRVAVHRLRQWLHQAVGNAVHVRRTSHGYELDTPAGEVDADNFRRLVARGAELPSVERASVLAEALELWRGPALVDVPRESVDRTALDQLSRQRTVATVLYAKALIQTGRPEPAVRALVPLVHSEPLDEEVHGAWIEALAASGRQAEALEAYETVRVRLRDELGIEPSRELSKTLTRVLRQDLPDSVVLDPPRTEQGAAVPAQLPTAVSAFTGRTEQLRVLSSQLPEGDVAAGAVVISAIAGSGGIGKTALATYWGRMTADRFPDGQLYIDLRGYSPDPPVAPIDALGQLLRGIGIPDSQVSPGVEEAAAFYRSTMAGRRMLIVLDNAADAAQVRPLLPGAPGCLVLVTSRDRLSGLVAVDGARRITLDTLSIDESVALLTALLGPERVAAESAAAVELADACACLPLALRIAAANLLNHPSQRIEDFVARLRSGSRWAALAVDGDDRATVRVAFDLSYRRLSEPARRVFRLLGLVPGVDFSVAAIAALAGCGDQAAQHALNELTTAHLLTEHRNGRYTFHDLLRAYAKDRAEHEETGRGAVLRRLFRWYLATADSAARRLYPKVLRLPTPSPDVETPVPVFDDDAAASEWLAAELANLVAIAGHAADSQVPEVVWLLSDALRMYLFRRRLTAELVQLANAALAAAIAAGNPGGSAAAQLSLATAGRARGDLPGALEHLEQALDHSRSAGWDDGQLATLSNIAVIHTEMGDLHLATQYLREVQQLNRKLGNTAREATAFNNLGAILHQSGRLADSVDSYRQALAKYHELGDDAYDCLTLHSLGRSLRDWGRLAEAREVLDRAMATAQVTGDKHVEAGVLSDLARLDGIVGSTRCARINAARALTLASDLGDGFEEIAALICLAGLDAQLGDLPAAVNAYCRVLAAARRTNQAAPETEALIGLAAAHNRDGRHTEAAACCREALARSHECGFRILEGSALTVLAEIHLAAGRLDRAARQATRAVAIQTATAHRLGEAKARCVLGQIYARSGERKLAELSHQQAEAIFVEIGACSSVDHEA